MVICVHRRLAAFSRLINGIGCNPEKGALQVCSRIVARALREEELYYFDAYQSHFCCNALIINSLWSSKEDGKNGTPLEYSQTNSGLRHPHTATVGQVTGEHL